ncbi:UDP-N-acetylmuramoyl-tripeptide--D-alanyl-D-alanine ligase [Roseburia sp. BX0805]|uniref:UDP-N-acetylmuramoyl-tripeptide--D-alanyl-D-alanine ligase n=1 Tax=Roseburia yibonii TaxID=2763063 RepID=A0ABR7I9C3_9FIRM|nr:UDP-N-acetylmuramoyl-tripeptide--D-alanyl-D-alanine ligase [Roseburia yibonii]MBC5753487.1 UDP-N-acetylmuramoyl-tripeptide--D-alanyl-D-alanine ligase [Roseburia yibonii]
MKNMTLENIEKACGGRYIGTEAEKKTEVLGVVIDSRQVESGYLFVAIPGEKVDGHKFIPDVFAKGAAAVLSEQQLEDPAGPYILVESTTKALRDLAEYYRKSLDIKVVGITGSVGKTSTKEMIASVLSEKYRVLKTEGNYNNEIGLPLTIFKIRAEHEVAVLEMGISEFGEMHRLATMANPDICVITNIGLCHLENLKTRDGILKAKTESFAHLKKDGIAILNGDDDKLSTIRQVGDKEPVFYGMEEKMEYREDAKKSVYATGVENLGLYGMQARIHTPEGERDVRIPIPGEHNVYNALAATAVGLSLGLSLDQISSGILKAKTIGGRTNLLNTGSMTVIDDCYNANPVSMKASIDVLATAEGRKIAVLGDMGELGENEKKLHYEVGEYLAKKEIDVLFCAGELSEEIAKAAQKESKTCEVYYFKTRDALLEQLLPFLKKGDTVLVKASHFMEYPKIVKALTDCQQA